MTMGKDDKLQRYFDGELPPDERAAFEAAMTDEDRERLAALAEMRALLSNALSSASAEIDVWSGVSAKLGGATPIDEARSKRRRKMTGRRFLGTSAGLLIAAAATFLFVVQPWHADQLTDDCDVESLEASGAQVTVLNDLPHSKDVATVVWTTEED
jgi:anti-sigma factor RsiW